MENASVLKYKNKKSGLDQVSCFFLLGVLYCVATIQWLGCSSLQWLRSPVSQKYFCQKKVQLGQKKVQFGKKKVHLGQKKYGLAKKGTVYPFRATRPGRLVLVRCRVSRDLSWRTGHLISHRLPMELRVVLTTWPSSEVPSQMSS